jgi:hypothetical protein
MVEMTPIDPTMALGGAMMRSQLQASAYAALAAISLQ